jgi:creatinine amidohydrolase/Fe(II)-dependent formamide hydrolase-like protein
MRHPVLATLLLAATAGTAAAQQAQPAANARDARDMGGGRCAANPYNCADAANPLPAPNTVWLEEMTWMDVRDAVRAGKTTVIIPTGGMEPNGPWLVTGKHNYVLHTNCEAIARKLGDALCAPIVKFVPEGNHEPPSGHMLSPGTISMREGTFRALLTDIVASLKVSGFKNVILIGDSGGNQRGQRAVADSLTALWKGSPVVAHVQEYYDYNKVAEQMKGKGLPPGGADGLHDDPVITLNMLVDDPKSVRYDERVKAGKATIDGFSLADRRKALELGREIVGFRAQVAVEAIRKAIANGGTLPAAAPAR